MDASALSGLAALRELTLIHATFPLEQLSGLVGLTLLNLEYSVPGTIASPGTIDALAPLVNFTSLDVSDGVLEDISTIAGMSELRTLDLYSNGVNDIGALRDLTNLTNLDLTDNFLNCTDADTLAIIAALEARGATVLSDCP